MMTYTINNDFTTTCLLVATTGIFCLIFGVILGSIYVASKHKSHSKSSASISKSNNNSPPLRLENVPKHIGVIMDGNRRFGKERHHDPLQGHWAGGQTLIDFIQWCMDEGVQMATVYAFSTENWSRDANEVSTLMTIFAKYAESMKAEALTRNVRVHVLSTDFEKLSPQVQQAVTELEVVTAQCSGFVLNICLSYGARAEIVQACKSVVRDVQKGTLAAESVTEEVLSQRMLTAHCPELDIMIRTSGECRLSNYLLWQAAYCELFFLDKYWPELTREDLREVLVSYNSRHRRYGT